MNGVERTARFLQEAKTYYVATVDGDQPHVRPFGTVNVFEDRLYIQTGRIKDVSKQLAANPKAEICAFKADEGEWVRITGELIDDPRVEAEQSMLDANPFLKDKYTAGDGNTQVLYFKDATATFCGFTHEPEVVTF